MTVHARYRDRAGIALDDTLADGQSESRAALTIGPMAEERIENALGLLGADSLAGIAHRDHRRPVFDARPHCQASSLRHRMVSILHQIEHDHAQVAVIGQDAQVVRGQFQMLDDTVTLCVKIEQLQLALTALLSETICGCWRGRRESNNRRWVTPVHRPISAFTISR